jgi:hypothetical protein
MIPQYESRDHRGFAVCALGHGTHLATFVSGGSSPRPDPRAAIRWAREQNARGTPAHCAECTPVAYGEQNPAGEVYRSRLSRMMEAT